VSEEEGGVVGRLTLCAAMYLSLYSLGADAAAELVARPLVVERPFHPAAVSPAEGSSYHAHVILDETVQK